MAFWTCDQARSAWYGEIEDGFAAARGGPHVFENKLCAFRARLVVACRLLLIDPVEQRQLIDGRAHIVKIVQVRPELRDAEKHSGKNEFRRDELTEGKLALDHQPTAKAEERGARGCIEEDEGDRLREVPTEMNLVLIDVPTGHVVGSVERVVDVTV